MARTMSIGFSIAPASDVRENLEHAPFLVLLESVVVSKHSQTFHLPGLQPCAHLKAQEGLPSCQATDRFIPRSSGVPAKLRLASHRAPHSNRHCQDL